MALSDLLNKNLFLISVILTITACSVFGVASQGLVASGAADITGTDDGTTDGAVLYASFMVCGGIKYSIVGPDVWSISGLRPGEDVAQTNPIVLCNSGNTALDLAFQILDDDIFTVNPWVSQLSWTPTTNTGEYTLGLIVCDPDIPSSPAVTEWSSNDILRLGMSRWYTTTGTFRPTDGTLAYEHEGTASLSLWAGPPGENIVHMYFRVVMSLGGALDTNPHAAQLEIRARLTAG
ncbi:hypothetical protein DRQ36_01390 [bacterium]|nr:MAG: hypothetical protein DRQ36_01390 [bacterium]